MPEHFLFHVVFLCQILVVSFVLPRQILARMRHVFETYPPSTHPRLYARPPEHYARSRRTFQLLNGLVMLAGLAILAVLWGYDRSGEWDHVIAMLFLALQVLPVIFLDVSAFRDARLLRDRVTTRTADLRPRRLIDLVSPALIGTAVATYVAFVALIVYVDQFDFPWFGGYANVVGITFMNAFLVAVGVRQVRGKKLNPDQSSDDRRRYLETIASMAFTVSISATAFVALVIALAAFDLRHLQPAAMSVYFQLLAVVSYRVYRVNYADFEVYREHTVAT